MGCLKGGLTHKGGVCLFQTVTLSPETNVGNLNSPAIPIVHFLNISEVYLLTVQRYVFTQISRQIIPENSIL